MIERVTVGPHTYIVTVSDLIDDAGATDRDRLRITLAANQAPSALRDTLLHEIVHACLATLKLDDDTEEAVCLALAPQLLSVLRDNPDLYVWLTA